MSEISRTNLYAFEPMFGGWGARLACTTATARVRIPGVQSLKDVGLVVSNGGAVSAFIRFGQSDVVADLNCMEILPQTQVAITLSDLSPNQVYMAGITESGTTKVQVTAGKGT